MARSFKGQRGVFDQPRRPTLSDPIPKQAGFRVGFTGMSGLATGQAPGFTLSPTTPSPGEVEVPTALHSELSKREQLLDTLRRGQDVLIPFELREQFSQLESETEQRIREIGSSVRQLNEQQEAIQDVFDTGSLFLRSQGIPATVQEAREDPEISAALDQINQAILTDDPEGLDKAIDSLAQVDEQQLDALTEVFGRDRWLDEMQRAIRTQVHNLVQERSDMRSSLIEAENWIEREAEAQQLNLWDVAADNRPTSRGLDVLVGGIEPWIEANFNGILSDSQADLVAQTLQAVWGSVPSAEELTDPETGEVVEAPLLTVQHEQTLLELATNVLGFSSDKSINFVEEVRVALQEGQRAAFAAEEWGSSEQLVPGGPDLATGIAEVAAELYDDPETVNQMANSYYLHRLIDIRSGGNINTRKGGNLFGLGALPEDTYEDMGYSVAALEGDPKTQLEALLVFIGMKYGPGYEGLQNALSSFVHKPDTWGDLPAGGF